MLFLIMGDQGDIFCFLIVIGTNSIVCIPPYVACLLCCCPKYIVYNCSFMMMPPSGSIHVYSTTGLVSVPIPSMVHSTTSPGFKNFGGVKPIPAPAGVPVAMMVPGFNVMPFESSLTMWSIPKISSSVLLSCLSSPLTRDWIKLWRIWDIFHCGDTWSHWEKSV